MPQRSYLCGVSFSTFAERRGGINSRPIYAGESHNLPFAAGLELLRQNHRHYRAATEPRRPKTPRRRGAGNVVLHTSCVTQGITSPVTKPYGNHALRQGAFDAVECHCSLLAYSRGLASGLPLHWASQL